MKVLHIIGSVGVGGIEKLVFQLAEFQANSGKVQPAFFISKKKGEWIEKFEESKIECIWGDLKSGYDWNPHKYQKIKESFYNFDILHFHSFNFFLALAAIASKKKMVYTEHGNFGFGRKIRISDRANHFLKKLFLKRSVDYITFNSKFSRDYGTRKYGLKNINQKVVYNGIDFSTFPLNRDGGDTDIVKRTKNHFVVGTTSRFAGFKRIDRLIDAFAGFQKNKKTVLLLVGDGALRKNLEAQAESLRIKEKVIFTGFRDRIHDYQNLMDVCVFPSQREPFGLVAVETLYLGKPTIVFSDGGGIKEIIEPDFYEDVVNTIEELKTRLEFYYANRGSDGNRLDLRRKRALDFSIEKMTGAFLEIYKYVL